MSLPPSDQRILSIEDDGVWERGRTYEVIWMLHWTTGSPFEVYKLAPISEWGNEIGVFEITPGTTAAESVFLSTDDGDSYALSGTGTGSGITKWLYDHWTDYRLFTLSNLTKTSSYDTDIVGGVGIGTVISTFTVPESVEPGTYYLAYMGFESVTDVNWVETLRTYFPITVLSEGGSNPAPFPESRPVNYNPDSEWNPKGGEFGGGAWTTPNQLTTLGGGRYNKQLVVLGHKKLYFGEI